MRVSRVVAETASVSSIYLAATDGAALPRARAGQYLTVRVEGAGPGSVRSYSLSSAPGGEQYRISVKRESYGTVSGFLHDRVAETAVLDVAAPRGAFVLEPGAEPGLAVRWPSDGRSVLDLADECDVPTQWPCRTGVCHTCVTDVLSGDVDDVTEPLERPGAGEALICCSRPASDLVLDL